MEHWSWKYIERPKRILSGYYHQIRKWDNAKIIQHEVDRHRYEIVYDIPFRCVMLLGWTDQFDDDYYWAFYDRTLGVQLDSCVGGFVRLKGKLSAFHYHQAKQIFEWNTPPLNEILKEASRKGYFLK